MVRLLPLALLAAAASALPTTSSQAKRYDSSKEQLPLANGFPKPDANALINIQKQAYGTLPNGDLPKNISDTSAAIWSLVAFNELFEVAFFNSLINNITDNVPGYEVGSPAARTVVLSSLSAILAQEELHALGANGILATANRHTISPCKYKFPVNSFDEAIAFSSTFTDVVLGTLQEAQTNFGIAGDGTKFVGLVGSVIGQEGEQNGFFRSMSPQMKVPSAKPFLTASSGAFAFSALQQLVIVPDSCPDKLPLPTFAPLTITTPKISEKTETLDFTFEVKDASKIDNWRLVLISGQNKPIVQDLQNVKQDGLKISASSSFPFEEFQLAGLTIAAITKTKGPFANATEVAADALAGPGLIEI